MSPEAPYEDLWRQLAPQVLGALVRRHGHFDACEDAVQEALLAASRQWPAEGVPDNPRGWLTTVASRRLVDELRSAAARRDREELAGRFDPRGGRYAPQPDEGVHGDDALAVLFLCCHPSLTPASQMALTLRAVGGLTTAEIARAFLVPEPTMARRIGRAKQRLAAVADDLGPLSAAERGARLDVVLHVLYLIFNEGYAASSGPDLQRRDLAVEAIRLVRMLHELVPDDGEVTGLLALLLLTDARHAARSTPDGSLVPIADQDRALWDRAAIEEGVALLLATLPAGRVGPYQLQAAIAAVHSEAPTFDDTDWVEILGLYRLLHRIAPSPVRTLNEVVAVAEVHGVAAASALLATVEDDDRLAGHHRVHAVRAHLLERAGDLDAAAAEYREAARRATSLPEQRHLEGRARALARPER